MDNVIRIGVEAKKNGMCRQRKVRDAKPVPFFFEKR